MKDKKKDIIKWIVVIALLLFAISFYSKNNFNEFTRSEANLRVSQFKRDSSVKYSKRASYRISSENPNDAMFFKSIKVKKNTPYKVTCMVKTENVVSENNLSGAGALISLVGSTEKSIAVTGSNDWQKIELIFNSKNKEEVEIGFRLGGYVDQCTGTAWFSDFTFEEGETHNDNIWKFACFIFEHTNVTVDGKQINISITNTDVSDIKDTIKRFQETIKESSNRKMTAKCDFFSVKTPISKITYDEEFGYYVAPEDVENSIKSTIEKGDYDHIFIIMRLGNDKYRDDIQINHWIGLGSMDYYGIGYSNIRLPNTSKSYIYRYDERINTYPEEVFVHEFLHSLERTAKEYDYEIPALHDNKKYGYIDNELNGLRDWYKAYMNKTIKGNVGLPEEVFKLKPAKNSDFEYSYKIDVFHEPQNIIDDIKQVFKNIVHNIATITKK